MCRPVAIFPWRRLAKGTGVSPCGHCGDIGSSGARVRAIMDQLDGTDVGFLEDECRYSDRVFAW
jgi:hypothetical protein